MVKLQFDREYNDLWVDLINTRSLTANVKTGGILKYYEL